MQRVNETSLVGDVQWIGPICRSLLEDRTDLDRALLARLMADGLIRPRLTTDLEEEFEAIAERLGFRLD